MLLELETGDAPAAWAALGFGSPVRVGPVTVRCVETDPPTRGVRGWTLVGTGADHVDGIPTRWAPAAQAPDGARALDHVVVLTDSLERTVAALVAAGGDERRRAAPMSFVRFGRVIVEVVRRQAVERPRIWGLVAVVEDLAALPADLVGTPKDAVQPGRRIVTARAVPGLGTAVAFMTPRPGSSRA